MASLKPSVGAPLLNEGSPFDSIIADFHDKCNQVLAVIDGSCDKFNLDIDEFRNQVTEDFKNQRQRFIEYSNDVCNQLVEAVSKYPELQKQSSSSKNVVRDNTPSEQSKDVVPSVVPKRPQSNSFIARSLRNSEGVDLSATTTTLPANSRPKSSLSLLSNLEASREESPTTVIGDSTPIKHRTSRLSANASATAAPNPQLPPSRLSRPREEVLQSPGDERNLEESNERPTKKRRREECEVQESSQRLSMDPEADDTASRKADSVTFLGAEAPIKEKNVEPTGLSNKNDVVQSDLRQSKRLSAFNRRISVDDFFAQDRALRAASDDSVGLVKASPQHPKHDTLFRPENSHLFMSGALAGTPNRNPQHPPPRHSIASSVASDTTTIPARTKKKSFIPVASPLRRFASHVEISAPKPSVPISNPATKNTITSNIEQSQPKAVSAASPVTKDLDLDSRDPLHHFRIRKTPACADCRKKKKGCQHRILLPPPAPLANTAAKEQGQTAEEQSPLTEEKDTASKEQNPPAQNLINLAVAATRTIEDSLTDAVDYTLLPPSSSELETATQTVEPTSTATVSSKASAEIITESPKPFRKPQIPTEHNILTSDVEAEKTKKRAAVEKQKVGAEDMLRKFRARKHRNVVEPRAKAGEIHRFRHNPRPNKAGMK